jgi:uncharacterized iron-regulated membrane protein
MWWRKIHRVLSLIVVLPFLVMLLTGLILQLRQQLEFVQPSPVVMERMPERALLSMDQVMEAAGVRAESVQRIIFRPQQFHLSLWLKDGRELQVHPQSGKILKAAPRYTNLLIQLHEGSYFSKWVQYLVFFPAGLGVVILTISGLIIYPRRRRRER